MFQIGFDVPIERVTEGLSANLIKHAQVQGFFRQALKGLKDPGLQTELELKGSKP